LIITVVKTYGLTVAHARGGLPSWK